MEGLILPLYEWLVSHGRLVPAEMGFTRIQVRCACSLG